MKSSTHLPKYLLLFISLLIVISSTIILLLGTTSEVDLDYYLSEIVANKIYLSNQNEEDFCTEEFRPDWNTYVNKEYGFSIRYPQDERFLHVTPHIDGKGVNFDNQPDGMPFHDVIGAVVNYGISRKYIGSNKPASIEGLLQFVNNETNHDIYRNVSISTVMICGMKAVKVRYDKVIGNNINEKRTIVYFTSNDKVIRAWLTIGNNFIGQPEELEYSRLFVEMLYTIRFL